MPRPSQTLADRQAWMRDRQQSKAPVVDFPTFHEQHYTVAEFVKKFGMNKRKAQNRFRDEPGVVNVGSPSKAHLRIPHSVAERVYREMQNQ